MKISTESGFTCEFDVDALNDWELTEILLDGGPLSDSLFLREILKRCMSEEDAQKLKDHVRTETGRIPTDALQKEVMEILEKTKATKNS